MDNCTLGRKDAFPLENYKKGVKVWIKDPEKVWIPGELVDNVSFASTVVQICVSYGEETKVCEHDIVKNGLPFLCNPDILLGKDDLTSLSYLHEPAVLNNLRYRFETREAIYTYCGIVLVAINPYADCSHLYKDEVIMVYRGVGKQVRDLDPHIYAIAEEAYFDMREFGKNQSVIISGESGAGKTVSAKFVMRYLANVASKRASLTVSAQPESENRIEDRVLASNPIMEAIGNAKTARNDNSSRFGKFIQINFSDKFRVAGAEMKTYLLEKSRVVLQSDFERNFHIFYQMCASRQNSMFTDLQLLDATNFHYTNAGGDVFIDGVNDNENMLETIKAFEMLNISHETQREIFRVLAGVLFLGNINFSNNGEKAQIEEDSIQCMEHLCGHLLDLDITSLSTWLTAREIRAGGESVRKALSKQEALANRDAIAKTIYTCLFQWIVEKINDNLMEVHEMKTKRGQPVEPRFIGVLDIYGFETFETNSFEQFCINYANEKLQQQFNQHVFKLEQAEYEREGISWITIDFYDNQPCLSLIESRPGIVDYLDEQCKIGRGTDLDWLNQMANCPVLKLSDHLQIPKIRNSSFVVRHFSSPVSYKVEGFIEKNKDTANEQLLDAFGKTKFKFLREVLKDVLASSSTGAKRKKTVVIQFRDSLKDLISTLSSTRPHYVRCIKPNDQKESFYFEPKRAIQQLRACGVLETVRISAAGFPSRWAYEEFSRRYRVLNAKCNLWRRDPKEFANITCQKWMELDKFALGKTKIFFRTGQVALMERVRHEILQSSALKIQSLWRGQLARRRYAHMKEALCYIQAATRAFLAYRRIKYLQMNRAAIIIQSNFRCHYYHQSFLKIRQCVLSIQSHFRASLVRKQFFKAKQETAAIKVQKVFRGWIVRRNYGQFLQKVIKVQCCARRWLARRKLKDLRKEARSLAEKYELSVQSVESERLRAELLKSQASIVTMTRLWKRVQDETNSLKQSLANLTNDINMQAKSFGNHDVNTIGLLKESIRKMHLSLTAKDEAIVDLKRKLSAEMSEKQTLFDSKEREVESRLEQMSQQLVKNAALLTSRDFVRGGNHDRDASRAESMQISEQSTSLMVQQQNTINELRRQLDDKERAVSRLQLTLSSFSANQNSDKFSAAAVYEAQKIQDLELIVSKYKADMQRILDNSNMPAESVLSLEKVQEENERLREESIEIRSLLAAHFERQITALHPEDRCLDSGCWSATNSDDGTSSVAHSEMDERIAQERLLRNYKQLLDIASRELSERDEIILSLESRLECNLANSSSFNTSDAQEGTDIKTELQREQNLAVENLVQENLSLQQKLIRKSNALAEAKAHLRGYSSFTADLTQLGAELQDPDLVQLDALRRNDGSPHSALLQVFNVPEFTRILVYDFKPRMAKRLMPCLPSYLMLMAFRYYDQTLDDAGLTGLFNSFQTTLKEVTSNATDTDTLALWLINGWRLFNLLRQYSNEEQWKEKNTCVQMSQCIKNFNLEPLRNQLKLRVDLFYNNLMKRTVEPLLIPKIVPAVLQHESGAFMTNGDSKESEKRSLPDLIEFLNFVFAKLKNYGADEILTGQVFRQISQWICSLALNHMMFRRELCTPVKAISIKHNVMEIQAWLSENKIRGSEMFEPLIQASHLLQIRKSEAYLDILCGETTSKLNSKQVMAILRHFSPSDGFEDDALTEEFLAKVNQKLASRSSSDATEKDELLMRGTYLDPFDSDSFLYTDVQLETISLPTCLDFQSVSRLT
ncbi:myosin head (motor domain) domain-containing protein [Ditylenchus destructor]|uniref:Myosin head (Motor domain) domain-containing protein n=1 Tax=Ditylenchus destructor TaxID=166010 RepID=A0AAD4NA50_9BILA|nr:myosin head (motor domain) domain-containing protein [Ditylenchus destructor]